MGTRSSIGMEVKGNGKVLCRHSYCHWDGYPTYNGRILLNHYTTPEKVEALIDLGSMSVLRESIGQKHDFDKDRDMASDKQWSTFYHRDRGLDWEQCKPNLTPKKEWVGDKDSWCEFFYLFGLDGKWRVSEGGKFKLLTQANTTEKANA